MIDKAIFDWLAEETRLPRGVLLFRGPLPESAPDTCVAVIHRGGLGELDGRVAEVAIQVYVRAVSQDEALRLYSLVREILLGKFNVPLEDGLTFFSASEVSQGMMGQDERGRYVVSGNYTVRTQRVL